MMAAALALLMSGTGNCYSVTIHDANDLIEFSNNVSTGISYSGTTVYLGDNIDFTDELSALFNPIGLNNNYYFYGVFDGLGHTISNLKVNSSNQYVGLFGYTRGTFRNFVLDASCSFESTYYSSSYIGSVAGYWYIKTNPTYFENIVNFADVSFTGSIVNNNLYIGGIVGYNYNYYGLRMKNCANYGSVTTTGTSNNVYIGGIMGYTYDYDSNKMISNCLNYGMLSDMGTSNYDSLYAGGIVGHCESNLESCVSSGKISFKKDSGNTGGIVGYMSNNYKGSHCVWTSDTEISMIEGTKSGGDFKTYNNSYFTERVNGTVIDELNDLTSYPDAWLFNEEKEVTFNVLGNKEIKFTSPAVLIPNLTKGNAKFYLWYTDKDCTQEFTQSSVSEDTTLYGKAECTAEVSFRSNSYTITKSLEYAKPFGLLPTGSEKTGYAFAGWFTKLDGKGKHITAETLVPFVDDSSVYGYYTINNYTVTFNFDNGEENLTKSFEYNSVIQYPKDPTKIGYSFVRWYPEYYKMLAYNFTTTAQWNHEEYTLTIIIDDYNSIREKYYYNDTITYTVPSREGYTFVDWVGKIDTMPAHDYTITTTWTINNYTVTFNFDNGEENLKKSFEYNSVIQYPKDPTKEGYSFVRWYPEYYKMPAYNFTITAQWRVNTYTLTFVLYEETNITVLYNYSDTIIYTIPSREGYTFVEWIDKVGTMPAHDHVITATWTINDYTMTFEIDDGVTTTDIFTYKSEVVYPHVYKENYRFERWNVTYLNMPAYDAVVKVIWKEKPSEYLEITFDSRDVNEKDITNMLEKLTDYGFIIIIIEPTQKETKAIVKFEDIQKSTNFKEDYGYASDSSTGLKITEIEYYYGFNRDFAAAIYPLLALALLFLF